LQKWGNRTHSQGSEDVASFRTETTRPVTLLARPLASGQGGFGPEAQAAATPREVFKNKKKTGGRTRAIDKDVFFSDSQ